MKNSIFWKLILTAAILAWAVLGLFPLKDTDFRDYIIGQSIAERVEDEGKQPTVKKIEDRSEYEKLLSDVDAAVESGKYDSFFIALRETANEQDIDLHSKFFADIRVVNEPNQERRNGLILDYLYGQTRGKLRPGLDLGSGVSFTLAIDEEQDANGAGDRLEKLVEILDGRVNSLGVAEPIIQPRPPNRVEVQLPGVDLQQNPEIVDIIVRPARLDFRTSHRYQTPGPQDAVGSTKSLQISPSKPQEAQYEVMEYESTDRRSGQTNTYKLWVKRIPEAHGSIIENSYATFDGGGQIVVGFDTTDEGADVMKKMTQRIYDQDKQTGTQESLVVVLDGEIESVAGIQSPIGNSGVITGNYSQTEVLELVSALNNPLEFGLIIEQKQEVGPSLAEDARDASVKAAMYGAGAVILFMLAYYLSSGIVAVLSVTLNLTIVLGVLASVGATMTLPGVAALVLTIGMAVDANILIFERIREEIVSGKSIKNALQSGYDKAFSTIVDANVTTMITAAILFWLGTGPVKGFGLTLAIGIGSSVFSALIISRAFLELLLVTGLAKKLIPDFSLQRSLGISELNFLGKRKPAFIGSWAIVAAGVVAIAISSSSILGIDFRGGAEVLMSFNQEAKGDLEITKILDVAEQNNLGEVQPLFQSEIGQGVERLRVQVDDEQGRSDQLVAALQTAFPNAELVKVSESIIGATVSTTIVKNAILSVLTALVGILLYVAVRFEIGYGVGAVVATVHDIMMSIGVYVILGQLLGIGSGQFSAPMVAAILMIVGYSINDTIVVFDRIREELELNPAMKLFDVVNLAISRTLSRTLLTSITTFVAALALFIFGVGVVTDFALVFLIGILTGTFSSIFIASPVFFWWHKGDRKHVTDHEFAKPTYEWEAGSKRASKESQAKELGAKT
ncbi:MAG: protein translocase subunit SecD [Verrucomicrobiota bacterium]